MYHMKMLQKPPTDFNTKICTKNDTYKTYVEKIVLDNLYIKNRFNYLYIKSKVKICINLLRGI